VKEFVEKNEYDRAAAEFCNYIKNRDWPEYFISQEEIEEKKSEFASQVEEADLIMEHKVKLLGTPRQDLGENIDWWRAPEADWQWPTHLSRHYWLKPLLQAYRYTGEEKYAGEWVKIIDNWINENHLENPRFHLTGNHEALFPGYVDGPWASLSAGCRADEWLDALIYLLPSSSLTADFLLKLLSSLYHDHVICLVKNPRAANQYIITSKALVYLGILFPEFKNAKYCLDTGYERLTDAITNIVYPDGSGKEPAMGYYLGYIKNFGYTIDLAEWNNYELPDIFNERFEKMFEYVAYNVKPGLKSPGLGDAHSSNVSNLIKDGITRVGRENFKYILTRGEEGIRPESISAGFPYAGHYSLIYFITSL